MPRIPQKLLNSVFYLYKDEESALQGSGFGGTGFFVGVPSRHKGGAYIYAITNHHVACRDGFSVVRVNTHDGKSNVFDFSPHDWHFDPKYDVAAVHIPIDPSRHPLSLVGAHNFIIPEHLENRMIGVGEDVFMIGRFVDHDGGMTNRPAVRFGNISVMPSPIEQPNRLFTDAYCIDLHSRSGYSGSPVFVYRTPGSDLEEHLPGNSFQKKILVAGDNYLALLGIHFAQFPESWEIEMGSTLKREASSVPLVTKGAYVKGLSGMTCVLPSWVIMDLINSPKLVKERELLEDAEDERLKHFACTATPTPE